MRFPRIKMARSQAHQKVRPVKMGNKTELNAFRAVRSDSSLRAHISPQYSFHREENSALDVIKAQRQIIEEIQLEIDQILRELGRLPDDEDDSYQMRLEDKLITLKWSLSDQKERLNGLIRQQTAAP